MSLVEPNKEPGLALGQMVYVEYGLYAGKFTSNPYYIPQSLTGRLVGLSTYTIEGWGVEPVATIEFVCEDGQVRRATTRRRNVKVAP
jgi:hypothetical protein